MRLDLEFARDLLAQARQAAPRQAAIEITAEEILGARHEGHEY